MAIQCKLTSLQEEIGACAKLEYLDVSGNALTRLPATLANCKKLWSLGVKFNKLEDPPDELGALVKIAHVQLDGSPLTKRPALKTVDSDKVIAFLAAAGGSPATSKPPKKK